jgi:kynurenine formamidase
MIQMREASSRRSFLAALSAAAGAVAMAPFAGAAPEPAARQIRFTQVIDLTHTLHRHFPSPFENGFEMEQVQKLGPDKWNINRWRVVEHIGTHLDAPLHCTQLDSAEKLPADQFVAPLVVIDIRDRAHANADAQLTPADIRDWEARHGPVPVGAVVAMMTGWDAYVNDPARFLGNAGGAGWHLPGFHVEAAQFLLTERHVNAIATDTISLDVGMTRDFPVHHVWLGHNKWGLENLANLANVPVAGATIVVGAPKVAGASGGLSRLFALV